MCATVTNLKRRFFFSRFVLYDLDDVPRITFKMDITQRQNVDEVVLKIKIKLKVKQICQALILLNLDSVCNKVFL